MSTALMETGHNVETYRQAAAERIKALMEKWAANTLAIGAELVKVRDGFPLDERTGKRPGFLKWAQQVTGLSRTQVFCLVQAHDKFGHRSGSIKLAQKVLFLLSRHEVPESARIEIVRRAERGEHISKKEAQKIADKHKLPGPKVANRQAREEGRPVLASDGYIYFGGTEQQAKEGESRRSMVYGVHRALEHLGGINLTGRQFLAYALPHQLWTEEEAPIIKKALKWLRDLDDAWDSRERG